MNSRGKALTSKMLMKKVGKSLAQMDKLNFLESYAMFMGKVQLIEFGLKKILIKRYRYGERKLEKMTLGGAISELERLGLRKDFVFLLRQLNEHRIKMAHEFLADHFHLTSLDHSFGRLSLKPLNYALWKVQETIHVYDWLNQNRWFYKRQRKAY
jgi:hypothetical protein